MKVSNDGLKAGDVIAFKDGIVPFIEGRFGVDIVDITPGKHYTIAGVDDDGDEWFIDDVGDKDFAACERSDYYDVISRA